MPGPIAFLVGFLIAIAAAFVNGLLVTRVKLPPFIVTLGTLSIFTALTLIYAKGQTISLAPGGLQGTRTGFAISAACAAPRACRRRC